MERAGGSNERFARGRDGSFDAFRFVRDGRWPWAKLTKESKAT